VPANGGLIVSIGPDERDDGHCRLVAALPDVIREMPHARLGALVKNPRPLNSPPWRKRLTCSIATQAEWPYALRL
jgi:hypothetical protein